MNVTDIGKSLFVWATPTEYRGDTQRMAREIAAAGFQTALLHSAYLSTWRTAERVALVAALRAEGVRAIGSAAVYGNDPAAEGRQAAGLCEQYNLEAFVFDAESRWDAQPNADSNTVKLLQTFRAHAPAGTLAGWCWWSMYKSPSGGTWHPMSVLWAAMHEQYGAADFGMPMAYWSWGNTAPDAVRYLEACWKQWREITDKPVIPAGRAYIGDGGVPNAAAIAAFEARARSLGAAGITWWDYGHAAELGEIWAALRATPQWAEAAPETIPEPEPARAGLPLVVTATALNVRNGPGTHYPIVDQLKAGERVTAVDLGGADCWIEIAPGQWAAVQVGGTRFMQVPPDTEYRLNLPYVAKGD